ncbi:unnamed protein product [Owenia fusiformis]|uniref:Uncharacterized protein n=1 Tax=Owenia fusiformis TaxID=6347 RepID=A0A8J1XRN6_OWEFU|nr:unnamed protein product [Owenia fusiformis]
MIRDGMMTCSKTIKEWLAEFKRLPTDATVIYNYACALRDNDAIYEELIDFLNSETDYEVLDPVCHQLFEFYRSEEPLLRRFTLELVPTLITAYLIAHSNNQLKRSSGIEACLLAIYNLEVVNVDGTPRVKTLTIPSLAKPSLYHEPTQLSQLSLTETSLSQYAHGEPQIITIGPNPQVECINAQNRLQVLTYILQRFNSDVVNLSSFCHQSLCKNCSRLVNTGFENIDGMTTSPSMTSHSAGSPSGRRQSKVQFQPSPPRISLNSGLLLEMLNGIYFAMFNGQTRKGKAALEDIHKRASYELYSDVLLITNAVKNSLQFNPSGQPEDGPMGVAIAVTPSTSSTSVSKAAITNASFRAKKLPDDIALQEDVSDLPPKYDAITEEDGTTAIKSEPVKSKKSGPLKSVLKKSDNKTKLTKRDSDVSAKSFSSDGPQVQVNGDTADPTGVVVVLKEAKQHVDTIELNKIATVYKKKAYDVRDTSKRNSTGSSMESKVSIDTVDYTKLSGSADDVTIRNSHIESIEKPVIVPASHSSYIVKSNGSSPNMNSSNGTETTQDTHM